eukprot:Hpha_TRINITY_DN6343_c0_g1::TRINITY_DN6343_c0_g1_i2::g.145445::m.145445
MKSGMVWKMVCSNAAYESPDGLSWSPLPFAPIASDDTKPTAYWDNALGKYVISVRRDVSPGYVRTIGRCVTGNLSDWQQEANSSGCPVVFRPDAADPPGMDVYTNAWTPYPSPGSPAVHLFFPSMYAHFNTKRPWGFGNDGLLDIRLVVSRDGKDLHYAGPRCSNARRPFVPLGPTDGCGPRATSPNDVSGGWCSPYSGVESSIPFDTSAAYMASGHLLSPNGREVFLYSSGQPFTHGGDSANQTWANNTGLRLLRLRRDGFVSLDAPYNFSGGADVSKYPSAATVGVRVPALPCAVGEGVAVKINFASSVVGFVAVSLEQQGQDGDWAPLAGYGLEDADRLQGNALDAIASWGHGARASLGGLVGQIVSFRVAMADSSLYAIDFTCTPTH